MTSNSQLSFFRNRRFVFREQFSHWKNNWRNGLLRLAERVIAGGNVSDLLGGNGTQISHLDEFQPALIQSVRLISPGSASDIFAFRPINSSQFLELQIVSMPQYLMILKEARVDIRSGLPRLPLGFLLTDVLSQWQRLMYRGGMAHALHRLNSKSRKIKGRWTVIPYSPYFFHTIVEELPSALKGAKFGQVANVAVTDDTPDWAIDLLSRAGLEVTKFNSDTLDFEEFVAVTAPRGITREDIQLIRERLDIPQHKIQKRKIWITRGNLDRANPALENSILELLKVRGFESVDPSEMPLDHQINFFSEASVICGFHSGALTNMIWAGSTCKVIEIFNHPYRTHDYARLANACGHEYTAVELSRLDDVESAISQTFIEAGL
jgi:hypothetical protein